MPPSSPEPISPSQLIRRYADSRRTPPLPGHGLSTLQIFDAYNKFRAPHPGLRRFPDGVELADLPSLAAAMLDCGLDPQPFFAALMDQAESAGRRLHDQTHKEP